MVRMRKNIATQTTGNIGLYYVCYRFKNEKASHWMPRDYYCRERFREKWQRIGKGGR